MLEIITGRAGSGKTLYVLDQIKKELLERPLGPAIILLLPEHMTYKVERQLSAMMEKQGRGYMRCQVYGFKRFAYQVLQETGGGLEQGITDMGRQLLLKCIDTFLHHLNNLWILAELLTCHKVNLMGTGILFQQTVNGND